jgi:hypothetical protein
VTDGICRTAGGRNRCTYGCISADDCPCPSGMCSLVTCTSGFCSI